MLPTLLFRPDQDTEDEFAVCQEVYGDQMKTYRSELPGGSLVVGRYSVLPFYHELEEELALKGSKLINSYAQHRYIADMENWYTDLQDATPRSWFNVGSSTVPDCPHGWIVKGRTNSRKFHWASQMYAPDRTALRAVVNNLMLDTFIRDQGLVFREYVPLEKLGVGINRMPITNEWRFFFLNGHRIARGFYWSILEEELQPAPTPEMDAFAQSVADRIGDKAPFVVIDVARTAAGDWTVIELNDGQMSGLSMIDPLEFYQALLGAQANL